MKCKFCNSTENKMRSKNICNKCHYQNNKDKKKEYDKRYNEKQKLQKFYCDHCQKELPTNKKIIHEQTLSHKLFCGDPETITTTNKFINYKLSFLYDPKNLYPEIHNFFHYVNVNPITKNKFINALIHYNRPRQITIYQ